MLDRQIEVKHPASGTTKLSYDLAGNLLTKQTANLADKGTSVSYGYDFNLLTSVTYPEHPENNVRYIYGVDAGDGRNGRVAMKTDASRGLLCIDSDWQYVPTFHSWEKTMCSNSHSRGKRCIP